MQKFLIIGNGFDLHHNLPTKYEHFIQVLQSIEKKNAQPDYTFNEIFTNISNTFKDQILKSYQTEKINYSTDTILNIKKHIQPNTWYQTFKHLSEIDTWIDFETQIENVLNIVHIFFEKAKTFIESNLSKTYIKVACIDTVNPENGFIINSKYYKILLDLKIILPLTHSDNKDYEGKINEDYFLVEKESIYAINEKQILEDLLKSLNQFIQIFNLYFTDIIEPFYKNYLGIERIRDEQGRSITIQTTTDSQVNPYENKFRTIFSFNYTPTLQKYYQVQNISYIHGHIGSAHNMVLGISDINNELKQHKMFAFTKYYQKLYKNTDFNFLENEIFTGIRTQIYVWGHSLDQSDGEYISKIIDALHIQNSLCKLIIFFHNDSSRANHLLNLLSICGKEPIEKAMKKRQLIFHQTTNENLFQMIKDYDSINNLFT